MSKALIVVDMIHDFIADDGALTCGKPGQVIVPYIINEIHNTVENGGMVYLCGDNHETDDPEFSAWPVHAVKGTPGAEWLKPIEEAYNALAITDRIRKVNKTKYNAFFRTELAEELERFETTEVEVAGVCTSICVYSTIQEAASLGYSVRVQRSCVADFNLIKHDMFLEHMTDIFKAKIID